MVKPSRTHEPPHGDEGAADPAHAPGKRRLPPPDRQAGSEHGPPPRSQHDQPWVPTSGLVGRTRRSARRG